VELLISVTILAIIVIPLMHVFLTSSKINIKSRKTLRATTVAQDIMEGLKAYDIEELKTQFNNPGDGFYVINDSIVKGGVGEDETREAAEVSTDADGNPNPGYYCFTMEGVTLQGSEYDALIKIDGRDYMESGTHTAKQSNTDATGTPKAHNNGGFAVVSAIDTDNGTVTETYSMKRKALDEALAFFESDFRDDGVITDEQMPDDVINWTNTDTFFDTISRNIDVTLEKDPTPDADGNDVVNVSASICYDFEYSGTHTLVYVMGSEAGGPDPCGEMKGETKRLNIMYYPLYGTNVLDEQITINNGAAVPLELTVAKQVYSSNDSVDPAADPDVLSDAKLFAFEKNYKLDLKVQKAGGALCGKDDFTLRTNVGTNLVNLSYADVKDGDSSWQLAINGDSADSKKYNVFNLSGVRIDALSAPGTDNEITEVIYDVTVEVYKAGAADKDFPEEDKMVSIDGSKNN
jgi:hypothetical protein